MKFSVILPVYNSEKYLGKTIKSVLKQNLSDFELIIIDDKSTDSSLEIASSYQEKDNRIRLITKSTNKGVASARNSGLKIARGEYILFLDSDDVLPDKTLSVYNKLIDESHADIIQGKLSTFVSNIQNKKVNFKKRVFNRDKAIKLFLNYRIISGYAGGKVYKKKTISDIFFREDMSYGEDGCFFFECLMKSKSIEYASFNSYYYRIRNDSLSGRGQNYSEKNLDVFKQIRSIKEKTPKVSQKYIDVFVFEIYRTEISIFHKSSEAIKSKYNGYYQKMFSFCNTHWLRVLIISINPRIKLNVIKYILNNE